MANDWLYEDEQYVLENYKKIPTKVMAAKMNKSTEAIRSKYYRMIKKMNQKKYQNQKQNLALYVVRLAT